MENRGNVVIFITTGTDEEAHRIAGISFFRSRLRDVILNRKAIL